MSFKQNKSISPVVAVKPHERQRREEPAAKIRGCGGGSEMGIKGVSVGDKRRRRTRREKGGRGGVWDSFGSELLCLTDRSSVWFH